MGFYRPTASILPLLLAIAIAGCGGSGLESVTGTVKMGDKPLTTGNITFTPVGGGPVGSATIQSDGSFAVRTGTKDGLAPGEYQITVRATGPLPPPTPDNLEPLPPLLTPEKYASVKTSGLKCTVPCKSLELLLDAK